MSKERIYSINLIKALAATAIFLYHAYWNIGCRYGVLDVWIEQSYLWMTLFFMLSGVVLRYTYSDNKFDTKEALWSYFGKRALSIFPIYFLIYIFYLFTDWSRDISEDIITLPFQFTLTQEFSHYPYLINAGTWFFSCIFICYLLFPYLNKIAGFMSKGQAIEINVLLIVLLGFTPLVAEEYLLNIYNNIFVRIIEFSLGVFIVRIIEESPKAKERFNSGKILQYLWIPILVLFLVGIYELQQIEDVDNMPMYFNMYSGIACTLLLYTFIISKSKVLDTISKFPVIKFLSDHSMEIWCATFFTTSLAVSYQELLSEKHFNSLNIIISAVINLVIAVLLKLYTKLIRKLVKRFGGFKVFLIVPVIFIIYFIVRTAVINYMYDEYDFINKDVSPANMEGAYHDEGLYAWVSDEYSVTFNREDVTSISFTAATSVSHIGNEMNCAVYIDDTLIGNVVVNDEIQYYSFDIPEGVIKSKKFKVSLISDKSFYAEGDPRELAIRIYNIRCFK